MEKTVLTYGTFDLFHIGHLRLLQRLKALGTRLGVGVSTDEFNAGKGKRTIIPFESRIEIVRSLRCVDFAFPEHDWEQKAGDIARHGAAVFAMGSDWEGKFDHLRAHCEVVYLPRTEGVSSTEVKSLLRDLNHEHIGRIKESLDLIESILERLH